MLRVRAQTLGQPIPVYKGGVVLHLARSRFSSIVHGVLHYFIIDFTHLPKYTQGEHLSLNQQK